jgi:hypothetical protein
MPTEKELELMIKYRPTYIYEMLYSLCEDWLALEQLLAPLTSLKKSDDVLWFNIISVNIFDKNAVLKVVDIQDKEGRIMTRLLQLYTVATLKIGTDALQEYVDTLLQLISDLKGSDYASLYAKHPYIIFIPIFNELFHTKVLTSTFLSNSLVNDPAE